MSRAYRINVRFDLEKPQEREASEYLRGLAGSRNRFIVEAVLSAMEQEKALTLQDIREVLREELQAVSVTGPAPREQTAEEQEANALQVLEDLKLFD